MNKVKKNQIVVVILVLMIVAAGYLNYRSTQGERASTGIKNQNSGEESGQKTAQEGNLADGVLTPSKTDVAGNNGNKDESAEAQPTGNGIGQAILVESAAVVPEYFAEAKVERENARAKSQTILYELMANADTPENEKAEAAQQILELQKRIENEAAAEAMIKAKGFDETYVRIYDDCVDVIVDRQEITQQEAAQIQDIITRITSLEAKDIRISLLKISA